MVKCTRMEAKMKDIAAAHSCLSDPEKSVISLRLSFLSSKELLPFSLLH